MKIPEQTHYLLLPYQLMSNLRLSYTDYPSPDLSAGVLYMGIPIAINTDCLTIHNALSLSRVNVEMKNTVYMRHIKIQFSTYTCTHRRQNHKELAVSVCKTPGESIFRFQKSRNDLNCAFQERRPLSKVYSFINNSFSCRQETGTLGIRTILPKPTTKTLTQTLILTH